MSEAAVDDKVAAPAAAGRSASARSDGVARTPRAAPVVRTTRSRPSCAPRAAASFVLARNHGSLLPLGARLAAHASP